MFNNNHNNTNMSELVSQTRNSEEESITKKAEHEEFDITYEAQYDPGIEEFDITHDSDVANSQAREPEDTAELVVVGYKEMQLEETA